MKRGDLVAVSSPGAYGKPRPAVVVQSDALDESGSVLVCLLTSDQRDAPFYRLPLTPTPENGLRVPSDVMIDKVVALARAKCGQAFGRLTRSELVSLNHRLALMMGLADAVG